MDIEEQKQGSLVIVSPTGRVDGYTAPELEKCFSAIVERGDNRILLDCAGMIYISSAGLRSVLVGSRKCQQAGGKLTICALQPDCRSVMEASGFATIIPCYDNREAALAAET